MHFRQKLAAALTVLASTGMRRREYAPPLFRLLWRFRVRIPPPHFRSFLGNFAFLALPYGAGWGASMYLIQSYQGIPSWRLIGVSVLFGSFIGSLSAGYYRSSARKHRIPAWRGFRPTDENVFS